jgi:hypothetical protein
MEMEIVRVLASTLPNQPAWTLLEPTSRAWRQAARTRSCVDFLGLYRTPKGSWALLQRLASRLTLSSRMRFCSNRAELPCPVSTATSP